MMHKHEKVKFVPMHRLNVNDTTWAARQVTLRACDVEAKEGLENEL